MSERRLPWRLIGWSVALVLLALPLLGLMYSHYASERWPIRSLEVRAPYQHVTEQALRAAVMPHIHGGFFATHLAPVQKSVEALPWVASAEVRKRWPDTLVIRVSEREPFAHWNGQQLVDRRGAAFSVPDADKLTGLPHLSGPEANLSEVVTFFVRVQRELAAVGLHVDGVHLDDRGGWNVDLAGGANLAIGRNTPDARLARFIAVYPQLAETHSQSFAYADLRYTNGFAVRWSEPATSAGKGRGVSST